MARSKVKSRPDHDAAHLHPKTNVSTKYQLPTPYSFRDIARTRFYRSRSLQQGQIKVTQWCCTPTPLNQCPYHVSTFYTLWFPRYSPDHILNVKSKVKPRSRHEVANLRPLTNVPTKYELPTHYSFWDIAQTRFSNSSSHRKGQIKVTPWCCTPAPPNQCPYQVSTSSTSQFLKYRPNKLFPQPIRPKAHTETMGCGVKITRPSVKLSFIAQSRYFWWILFII